LSGPIPGNSNSATEARGFGKPAEVLNYGRRRLMLVRKHGRPNEDAEFVLLAVTEQAAGLKGLMPVQEDQREVATEVDDGRILSPVCEHEHAIRALTPVAAPGDKETDSHVGLLSVAFRLGLHLQVE